MIGGWSLQQIVLREQLHVGPGHRWWRAGCISTNSAKSGRCIMACRFRYKLSTFAYLWVKCWCCHFYSYRADLCCLQCS